MLIGDLERRAFIEALAALPLEERYVWRVASALKWAFADLETLSGEVSLSPGREASHKQRWRILDPGFTSSDCKLIAALAGCASNQPLIIHAAQNI